MSSTLSKTRMRRPAVRTTDRPIHPELVDAPSKAAPALSVSEQIYASYALENLRWNNIDWVTSTFLVAVHLGCLAAPFYFTWSALAATVVLHWLTCSIGVCLGYHRFLSHRSMKLRAPAKFAALLCGTLSGEGSPLTWAATHRLHHHRSDQDGDPHSPVRVGPWWSHILWLFVARKPADKNLLFKRYIPDLLEDRMMVFFEYTYGWILLATGLTLLAIGGLPWLVWAFCVRMTAAYHSTWFVNSATHLWGYRNYETRDASRNLWWVAILAYGEGWHNNHHAHPATARAGHRAWELDPTWWAIATLRAVGLAYEVDDRIPTASEPVPEPSA